MIKNNKLQRMYNKYTEECGGTDEMFYKHIIRLLNRKMYIFVYGSKIFSGIPYEVLDIIYSFCNFDTNYNKYVSLRNHIWFKDFEDDVKKCYFYNIPMISFELEIKILDKTYIVKKKSYYYYFCF